MRFSRDLQTLNDSPRARSSPRIDQHAGQKSKASPSPSGAYGNPSQPQEAHAGPSAPEALHVRVRPPCTFRTTEGSAFPSQVSMSDTSVSRTLL
jgi:hypothetical protein